MSGIAPVHIPQKHPEVPEGPSITRGTTVADIKNAKAHMASLTAELVTHLSWAKCVARETSVAKSKLRELSDETSYRLLFSESRRAVGLASPCSNLVTKKQ